MVTLRAHVVCCCPGAIEPLNEIAITELGVLAVAPLPPLEVVLLHLLVRLLLQALSPQLEVLVEVQIALPKPLLLERQRGPNGDVDGSSKPHTPSGNTVSPPPISVIN
jgi:hypothetical protein